MSAPNAAGSFRRWLRSSPSASLKNGSSTGLTCGVPYAVAQAATAAGGRPEEAKSGERCTTVDPPTVRGFAAPGRRGLPIRHPAPGSLAAPRDLRARPGQQGRVNGGGTPGGPGGRGFPTSIYGFAAACRIWHRGSIAEGRIGLRSSAQGHVELLRDSTRTAKPSSVIPGPEVAVRRPCPRASSVRPSLPSRSNGVVACGRRTSAAPRANGQRWRSRRCCPRMPEMAVDATIS